jgi:phage shock protein PspC (stress-responsive transcriptional regulator)
MKKVIEVSLGGVRFTVEDDAYIRLKSYLSRFEATIPDKREAQEVMEDVEARVAEIFQKEMRFVNQVVDDKLVQLVIERLGDVEANGSSEAPNDSRYTYGGQRYVRGEKRLFRNPDDKKLGGVCSGLAAYFDIDPAIVRILFVVAVILYGTGFLLYIILWVVIPNAVTVVQKLQMRGIAPTAENIKNFMSQHK